ncbi:hypothetical protein C8Q77DRAFT_1055902 [Trametes polyzona]|nr:hypothetical protein C8Q77DRAFT_1055902 [Trametes polyzona]
MDPSDIGRYGTLSLLRRLPVESVVTSYPIDDEELTIGRDQSCSLRLYYPAVSALHAKITFVERKAFLVVLGTNGLLLDDTPLFPAAAHAPGPTTVPLQNSSVIEIHKKRFRFNYPPKHLRPALINTPSRATPSRRPLRLSMIASAHVFTPGPSSNPQENLRVLQSPLRTPFAREQEEIVLVHSNTPRVVEEDKDLVILDEVEPEPEPVFPLPVPVTQQIPQTPVRRAPRSSLHRAVLIRSAHRAAIQREIQMEEEHEAEEVEETIAAIAEAEENDDDVQEVPPPEGQRQVTGWRKSLDLVKGSLGWAFRGLSVEPKEEEEDPSLEDPQEEEQVEVDNEFDEQMDEHEEHDEDYDVNRNEYIQDTPESDEEQDDNHVESVEELPRPLGRFMTPQLPRTMSVKEARMSLGGAGADVGPRRVRVVPPWKVSEIEVPTEVKEEEAPQPSAAAPPSTPRSPIKREKLSEEEREAIRARRRSALTTPDNFFKGQTPGSRRTLFPSLAPLPSPSFTQPSEHTQAASEAPAAPVKDEIAPTSVKSTPVNTEDDDKEDTAVLLARMLQMAEGVKQRQSLGRQSLNLSPRKREGGFSLLAPGHATMHTPSRILIEEDEEDDEETHERHDVEMQNQGIDRAASGDAPARAQPRTPRMSDLRHVFGRPHANPSMPVLTGVRDMFRVQPQGPPETPRMEGDKEMLNTPAAYRPASPEPQPERDDPPAGVAQPQQLQEEAKDEEIEQVPARAVRGRRAPGMSRIARRAPPAVPQSAPARSTRGASQVPEEAVAPEGTTHDAERAVRRTRARTADGDVDQPPKTARAKATEKKPATPEPEEDEEPTAQPPPTATRSTRRTRQTTDSSTSSHNDDTADVKPVRKTRAKTPTPATKTGATRRGTRAKPIEVPEEDNEDDPLDSLPRNTTPAAEEQPAPTAARVRRGTRSKIPVKQEEVEPPLPTEEEGTTAARTTRARRTPVPRHATPSTTGRSGTRSRGAAASTPAPNVEAAIPEDKENTPEPGEEDDQKDAKAPAARVRAAGKGTRKAASTAKEAASEEAPVAAGTGARTRATCVEISRLPQITEGIKSVNFRRTTPGSIYRVVYANKPPPRFAVLDPTHPALTYHNRDYARAFPWRIYPDFKLRAIPHGLLEPPSQPHPSPPYVLNTGTWRGRRVNMSLLDIAPRDVGGHVARQDILRKFKTAISLIVTRGADVEGEEGGEEIVFRKVGDPDEWVLPNWTYIVRPEDTVYRLPFQRLIPPLREALQATAASGKSLEKQWAKMREVAPPPRHANRVHEGGARTADRSR